MKTKYFVLLLALMFAAGCGAHQNKEFQKQLDETTTEIADLNTANKLLALKKCGEAIEAYKKVLEQNPQNAGAWNLMGLAHLCNSDPNSALSAFHQALAVSPTYTDVHNNIGVAYMETSLYDNARDEFLKALQDETYPKAGPYFNLARLAYLQKKL